MTGFVEVKPDCFLCKSEEGFVKLTEHLLNDGYSFQDHTPFPPKEYPVMMVLWVDPIIAELNATRDFNSERLHDWMYVYLSEFN